MLDAIVDAIGVEPYFRDDAVVIYHADCRDVLPKMPQVDLVLTDPPYGIGIAANPFRQRFEQSGWDDCRVDADLLATAISAGRDAIIWGGNYFGLNGNQCFLVWDKGQSEDFSSAMCEYAWATLKIPAKIYRRLVWTYQKQHPTQKPEELMRWCLSLVPDAQTILDPFMGSGTTLRAAKDLGRYAIGIEIEERYCEIAARRMAQGVLL